MSIIEVEMNLVMIGKILLHIGKNLSKAKREQVWFVPKGAGGFWGCDSRATSEKFCNFHLHLSLDTMVLTLKPP